MGVGYPPSIPETLKEIYPQSLDLKETIHSADCISYLDLHLNKGEQGLFSCRLYDKKDNAIFDIVYYPYLDSKPP